VPFGGHVVGLTGGPYNAALVLVCYSDLMPREKGMYKLKYAITLHFVDVSSPWPTVSIHTARLIPSAS
jgi:hypothetical protein